METVEEFMKNEIKETRQPKYKNEIREAIIKNVKKNKNVFALKDLLRISDIYLRVYDNKSYDMVPDEEFYIISIIRNVLYCEDRKVLKRLHFITGYKPEKRG